MKVRVIPVDTQINKKTHVCMETWIHTFSVNDYFSVNSLRSIWDTYQPKIKKETYIEKILILGDFLASLKV